MADRDAALAQRDGAIAALEHRLTHVALDEVSLKRNVWTRVAVDELCYECNSLPHVALDEVSLQSISSLCGGLAFCLQTGFAPWCRGNIRSCCEACYVLHPSTA